MSSEEITDQVFRASSIGDQAAINLLYQEAKKCNKEMFYENEQDDLEWFVTCLTPEQILALPD